MYKVGVRYLMLHVCVSFFFPSGTPSASGYPSQRQANCNDKCRGTLQKKKKKRERLECCGPYMQVLLTGRILINVYFEEHVQPYATEKEKRRNGSVIFFRCLGQRSGRYQAFQTL